MSQSRRAAGIPEEDEQPQGATAAGSLPVAGATPPPGGSTPVRDDDQLPADAAAETSPPSFSQSANTNLAKAKQQALNRSLSTATPSFAFAQSSTAPGAKLSRSMTGFAPPVKPFAFGNPAAPGVGASGAGQTLLQFGMGSAATAAAAAAGNAAGQLFGFSAPGTGKSVPSFGTGAFGGLGSGFSFGASNSSTPPSFQAAGNAAGAAAAAGIAAAAVKEARPDSRSAAAATSEVDSADGKDEEDVRHAAESQEDADNADADDSHFALPDDLLSDNEEEAKVASAEAGTADAGNAEAHTSQEDGASVADSDDNEGEDEGKSEPSAAEGASADEAEQGMRLINVLVLCSFALHSTLRCCRNHAAAEFAECMLV